MLGMLLDGGYLEFSVDGGASVLVFIDFARRKQVAGASHFVPTASWQPYRSRRCQRTPQGTTDRAYTQG